MAYFHPVILPYKEQYHVNDTFNAWLTCNLYPPEVMIKEAKLYKDNKLIKSSGNYLYQFKYGPLQKGKYSLKTLMVGLHHDYVITPTERVSITDTSIYSFEVK